MEPALTSGMLQTCFKAADMIGHFLSCSYHPEKSMPRLACCSQGEDKSYREQRYPSQVSQANLAWSRTHVWASWDWLSPAYQTPADHQKGLLFQVTEFWGGILCGSSLLLYPGSWLICRSWNWFYRGLKICLLTSFLSDSDARSLWTTLEGKTVLDSTLSLAQCLIMENLLTFMDLNFLICKEE